jgi:GT2 family glycosyltransferase
MINIITSCIVIYKNDKQTLLKAISSILSTKLHVKLFLIDNSPTDDLKNLSSDARIEYCHNPINPGFGAAHNIALKKALELGSKYHLVLNPDIYFDGGVIEEILQYMNYNIDVANLMPKVLYPDETTQYLCKLLPTPYDWIGRRFNPIKFMVNKRNHLFELRFADYNQLMEVPYLSGCFMFLRMEAIKNTGFFDEAIFMYGEDTDLCRRFIINNYKIIYFPNVTITHEFAKGSHKSFRLMMIGILSAIYYFNKWGWIFDKQRKEINKQALKNLGFSNSIYANYTNWFKRFFR